jgi:phage-related protein
MQRWVLDEAACLQRDAMSHHDIRSLVEYGYPLTRESYLDINNLNEGNLDAEQESELPHLFQESMIEERVASVMFEIEIDDTLRQLSEGAR